MASSVPKRGYGKRSCCVKNCYNSGKKLNLWLEEQCSSHSVQHKFCDCPAPYQLLTFPTSRTDSDHPKLLEGWIRCVHRTETEGKVTKDWRPNSNSRICSRHFLKSHPYPILYMGHDNIPASLKPSKREPPKRRKVCEEPEQEDIIEDIIVQDTNITDSCDNCCDVDLEREETDCDGCIKRNERINSLLKEIHHLKEQVQSTIPKVDLQSVPQESRPVLDVDSIKDDAQMVTYTGITKGTFKQLLAVAKPHAKKFRYWQGPKRTVNRVRKIKPGKKRFLSIKNELFMSLFKIKTDLHMRIIGDFFGLSCSTVSRLCFTWWRYLGRIVGGLVFNPEKDAVYASRPKSFNAPLYRNVRHIIDATEIFIETPKSLEIAAACWSDYKHHHTVKYLVSINPSGFINFVSKGWVGRASDNHVTEHCGFLDILEPFDKVRYSIYSSYFEHEN